MKTLLILLTTLSLMNCITNSDTLSEQPRDEFTTISIDNDFDTMDSITAIPLDPNTFSYWYEVAIWDFKGGGYSRSNTYTLNIEKCFAEIEQIVYITKNCIEERFTDYADVLEVSVMMDFLKKD